jgi:hypothetical protein
MHDRVIAVEDGEAAVLVKDREAEPVTVEVDGGGRVPYRQSGDRLVEAAHDAHPRMYKVTRARV